MAETQSVDIDFDHGFSHDIYKSLSEVTSRVHCVWLVKEWGGKSQGGITVHNQMGWLEDHVTCHIATFRDAGVRYFRRILVFLELDQVNDLVVESADHLAKVHQAKINFVGYLGPDANKVMAERLEDYLQFTVDKVSAPARYAVIDGETKEAALVTASIENDLLLLRSERHHTGWARMFGTRQDRLIEKAACSVVSLQAYVDGSDPTQQTS